MNVFLPVIGGLLIGTAAALLWLMTGRVAGISGIVGRLVTASGSERRWRIAFLAGLGLGGACMATVAEGAFEAPTFSIGHAVIAGLLVGVGTTLGNGCTSGHGVCGISRLSRRSVTATVLFMVTAMIVVFVRRHGVGVWS